MADGGDRTDRGQVEALVAELVEGGELGEQDAGQRRLPFGRSRGAGTTSSASQRCGSNGRGSGSGELRADGPASCGGLLDERGDPVGARVLLDQVAQGGEPVGALAAEGHGELLAALQPVGQGPAALGGRVVVGQRGRG